MKWYYISSVALQLPTTLIQMRTIPCQSRQCTIKCVLMSFQLSPHCMIIREAISCLNQLDKLDNLQCFQSHFSRHLLISQTRATQHTFSHIFLVVQQYYRGKMSEKSKNDPRMTSRTDWFLHFKASNKCKASHLWLILTLQLIDIFTIFLPNLEGFTKKTFSSLLYLQAAEKRVVFVKWEKTFRSQLSRKWILRDHKNLE